MTAAPARMPAPRAQFALDSDKYSTSIKTDKWTIKSTKKPILNGPEIEAYVILIWSPHAPVQLQETDDQGGKEIEPPFTRNDIRQQLFATQVSGG